MTARKPESLAIILRVALLIATLALTSAAHADTTGVSADPVAADAAAEPTSAASDLLPQAVARTTAPYSDDDELWSAKVHVTAGREAAERGEIGVATLYLERARYLRPFDIDIRQGLDLLRQQVQRQRMMTFHHARLTQGEADGLWWWRLFHVLPTRMWAGLALISLWLSFGFWLAFRRMKTSVVKDAVVTAGVLSLLLSIASLVCWTGACRTSLHLEPGVVIQSSPRYFRAPDELAKPEQSSDLYEGGVVLIRWRDDNWMEIELVGHQRVWVAANTVVPIAQQADADR